MGTPQIKHGTSTPLMKSAGVPAIDSGCCCGSGASSTCPDGPLVCAATPGSLTVSGLTGGVLSDEKDYSGCIPDDPEDSTTCCPENYDCLTHCNPGDAACSVLGSPWDGIIYRNGNHLATGCPSPGSVVHWSIDTSAYSCGPVYVDLDNGRTLCISLDLRCGGDGATFGWYIEITLGTTCFSCYPGGHVIYSRLGGPGTSITGTYNFDHSLLLPLEIGFPATITLS